MPTAIVTGASRGLGLALARALAERGWRLVIDARDPDALAAARAELAALTDVQALVGDVADDWHRTALVAGAGRRLDLLVNNASLLGPSPQPRLGDYPLAAIEDVYRINVFAPLSLIQRALPLLGDGGRIVNVTSDAAVESYEGWGGYGSSKATLEQLTRVLAVERPQLNVYAFDPADMNTALHQEAFPGEDISDRPPPEDSVPALIELLEGERPLVARAPRAAAPSGRRQPSRQKSIGPRAPSPRPTPPPRRGSVFPCGASLLLSAG